jgi:hypothetical protein
MMSVSTSDLAPWGLIQWIVTGIATILASAIAFVWRLSQRVEGFEATLEAHSRVCDIATAANEAAILRLVERLQQIHDEHFRLRETIGALPSRGELRDVELRIVEQVSTLAARLDRALERRPN